MIVRIVQHNNLKILDKEDFVLKFSGEYIKILDRSELVVGALSEHRDKLNLIYNQASYFFLEEVAVKYNSGAMDFIQDKFTYYQGIDLGMLYFDIMGSVQKKGWYGKRYSAESIQGNKPPVAFLNKKVCPGIPMVLDQQLLFDLIQKTPILYYPGEYLEID